MPSRSRLLVRAIAYLTLVVAAAPLAAQSTVTVDATAATRPFAHYWERMFGSGRAVLSLRESYRDDLRTVRRVTDIGYVRFHGIFLDDMGVYTEGPKGEPVYNFSYVDQAYDGLLANGVRPFVELSFMPRKLAARDIRQSFWYRPVVSPPKSYARWDALIAAFARHLVERYGIEELSHWYFEVWNEPNLEFWGGQPRQSTYWELYDHTVKALKGVDARLRVGGPATAQAAWVPAFIRHCKERNIPVDFVSTHVYGDDTAKDVFGTGEHIPRNRMVCRAVQKVHDEIQASPAPQLPLIWSEFNASWSNHTAVTDAPYMGPWLAETVRHCDGLVQDMSYWSFSDVFEEQGVVQQPFYGGFGLIAAGGIPKPAFNAFALLHKLGTRRFVADAEGTLATRRDDGALVVALWNYADVGAVVPPRRVSLHFEHVDASSASVEMLDPTHGNAQAAYQRLGAPRNPTAAQLAELRAAAVPAPAVMQPLTAGALDLEIPSDGLVLVTVAAQH
ncbi:MAG TPA: glycosyl hydrolase family 39 [Candidatus Dormibacteraeota bacterium]|nr:glycosyl hydrolase family 39 [Candidatus Dormibacteraeota bacterium]